MLATGACKGAQRFWLLAQAILVIALLRPITSSSAVPFCRSSALAPRSAAGEKARAVGELAQLLKKIEASWEKLATSNEPISLEQYVGLLRNAGLLALHGNEKKNRARRRIIQGLARKIRVDAGWLEKLEYVYYQRKGEQAHLDQGAPDHYTRLLLHFDEKDDFEAVILVWEPGHHTLVHDHGQDAWGFPNGGAVRVLSGNPLINNYKVSDEDRANATATLRRGPTIQGKPGTVIGVPVVHEVRNNTGNLVFSIHVYSSPVMVANSYLPSDPDIREFAQGKNIAATATKISDLAYLPISFAEIQRAPTKAQMAETVGKEISQAIEQTNSDGAIQALLQGVQLGLLPADADALLGKIRQARMLQDDPRLVDIVAITQKAHFFEEGGEHIDPGKWRYNPLRDSYLPIGDHDRSNILVRLPDKSFKVGWAGWPGPGELELLKKLVECTPFDPRIEERPIPVHVDRDAGIVVKEFQDLEEFEKRVRPSHELARERLGGLAARTTLLDEASLYVSMKRRIIPHLEVQESLTSLDKRLKYLVAEKNLSAAKKLIDEFIDLQHSMWKRHVVQPRLGFRGAGLTRDGSMRLLKLRDLSDDKQTVSQEILAEQNQANRRFLLRFHPALARYYAQQAKLEISYDALTLLWDTQPEAKQPMQLPPVLEWVQNKKMKEDLLAARYDAMMLGLKHLSPDEYREGVAKIAQQKLKGHPASHYIDFGSSAFFDDRKYYLVHNLLREVVRVHKMRRNEDKFLNHKALEKIAERFLAYRDHEAFPEILFAFQNFILKPTQAWNPAARSIDWEQMVKGAGVLAHSP